MTNNNGRPKTNISSEDKRGRGGRLLIALPITGLSPSNAGTNAGIGTSSKSCVKWSVIGKGHSTSYGTGDHFRV